MDPYSILRISRDASDSEIRKAYRKMAAKYHPDKGGEAWIFQQVQDAYQMLTSGEAVDEAPAPPSTPATPKKRPRSSDVLDESSSFSQSDSFGSEVPSSDSGSSRGASGKSFKTASGKSFKQPKLRPKSRKISRAEAEQNKKIITIGVIVGAVILVVGGALIAISMIPSDSEVPSEVVNVLAPPENIDSTEESDDGSNDKVDEVLDANDPANMKLSFDTAPDQSKPTVVKFALKDGIVLTHDANDYIILQLLKEAGSGTQLELVEAKAGRLVGSELRWNANGDFATGLYGFKVVAKSENGSRIGELNFQINLTAPKSFAKVDSEIAPSVPRDDDTGIGSEFKSTLPEPTGNKLAENSRNRGPFSGSTEPTEPESDEEPEMVIEDVYEAPKARDDTDASSVTLGLTGRKLRPLRKTHVGSDVVLGMAGCASYSETRDYDQNVNATKAKLLNAVNNEADIFCISVFDDDGVIRVGSLVEDSSKSAGLEEVLSYEPLEGAPIRLALELLDDEVSESFLSNCVNVADEAKLVGPDCKLQIRIPVSHDMEALESIVEEFSQETRDGLEFVLVYDPEKDTAKQFKMSLSDAEYAGFERVCVKVKINENGYSHSQLVTDLNAAHTLGFKVGIEELPSQKRTAESSGNHRIMFLKSIRDLIDSVYVQDISEKDVGAITNDDSILYLNVADKTEDDLFYRENGSAKGRFSISGDRKPSLVSEQDSGGQGFSLQFNASEQTRLSLSVADQEDESGVSISTNLKFPSSVPDGTTQCIVSKGSESAKSGFTLELHNPAGNGDSDCVFRFGVCVGGGVYLYSAIPFGDIEKERLCHVSAFYAGNGKIALRIDGGAVDSPKPEEARGGIRKNDLPIVLGARLAEGSNADYFDGSIQMLSISSAR